MQIKTRVCIKAPQLGVACPAVQEQNLRERKLFPAADAVQQNTAPLLALMLRVDDEAVQEPGRPAARNRVPGGSLREAPRCHRLDKRTADDAAGDFENKSFAMPGPLGDVLRRVAGNLLDAASICQLLLRGVCDP